MGSLLDSSDSSGSDGGDAAARAEGDEDEAADGAARSPERARPPTAQQLARSSGSPGLSPVVGRAMPSIDADWDISALGDSVRTLGAPPRPPPPEREAGFAGSASEGDDGALDARAGAARADDIETTLHVRTASERSKLARATAAAEAEAVRLRAERGAVQHQHEAASARSAALCAEAELLRALRPRPAHSPTPRGAPTTPPWAAFAIASAAALEDDMRSRGASSRSASRTGERGGTQPSARRGAATAAAAAAGGGVESPAAVARTQLLARVRADVEEAEARKKEALRALTDAQRSSAELAKASAAQQRRFEQMRAEAETLEGQIEAQRSQISALVATHSTHQVRCLHSFVCFSSSFVCSHALFSFASTRARRTRR